MVGDVFEVVRVMKDLVLQDIELCKQVAPIMGRLGIEPDGVILTGENNRVVLIHEAIYYSGDGHPVTSLDLNWTHGIKTYRQDKLALGLPEWWDEPLGGIGADPYQARVEINGKLKSLDFGRKYLTIRDKLHASRGQPQLEATARLLILLDKENLL